MRADKFLMEIIRNMETEAYLEVCMDGSIPKPIEQFFEIKKAKGHILFVPRSGVRVSFE